MRTPRAREEEDAELAAVSLTWYALARNRHLASLCEITPHARKFHVIVVQLTSKTEIYQNVCLVPSHYSARPIDREGLGKHVQKSVN